MIAFAYTLIVTFFVRFSGFLVASCHSLFAQYLLVQFRHSVYEHKSESWRPTAISLPLTLGRGISIGGPGTDQTRACLTAGRRTLSYTAL
jgi:hypothetical protein